ncbi:hypothetical protein GGX14DRAFT_393897 [Mycena pura]|uniref:Uncharacterized protein n=1 Tax=Mycena pura TaxID=153505 RepID=A0AAD6YBA7_9AGAR|nr:hypothetical protein GGX14DRAFT_393897 [Mycena pura]
MSVVMLCPTLGLSFSCPPAFSYRVPFLFFPNYPCTNGFAASSSQPWLSPDPTQRCGPPLPKSGLNDETYATSLPTAHMSTVTPFSVHSFPDRLPVLTIQRPAHVHKHKVSCRA